MGRVRGAGRGVYPAVGLGAGAEDGCESSELGDCELHGFGAGKRCGKS